jgi:hypothetical protein
MLSALRVVRLFAAVDPALLPAKGKKRATA